MSFNSFYSQMIYLDIYQKLATLPELSSWERLKMTFQIARCSENIRSEILTYLDDQTPSDFELNLQFQDPKTGELRNSTVTVRDVEQKLHIDTLPALLYMDWIRREPRRAAIYMRRIDSIELPSPEKLRAHIDPELLEAADKVYAQEQQADEQLLRSAN